MNIAGHYSRIKFIVIFQIIWKPSSTTFWLLGPKKFRLTFVNPSSARCLDELNRCYPIVAIPQNTKFFDDGQKNDDTNFFYRSVSLYTIRFSNRHYKIKVINFHKPLFLWLVVSDFGWALYTKYYVVCKNCDMYVAVNQKYRGGFQWILFGLHQFSPFYEFFPLIDV